MTKIQKFIHEITHIAEQIGAKKPGKLGYDWQVETRVGTYSFSIFHKSDEKRVRVYSIVGRFEEPKRAHAVYPCTNKFSGKYNFHQVDMDACLELFLWLLEDSTGKEIDLTRE